MPSAKDIKKEIRDTIKTKYSSNSKLEQLLIKIDRELNILESTEGLENKNNLDVFYTIWQNNKERSGSKNGINSWTSYALGVTSQKPTGEFLPTRRAFARASFPDIDTDFDYEYRGGIYNYIIQKYGRENVGNIGTHGSLKFKSCVTRVVKALDVADSFHKGKDSYISDNAAKVDEILSPFPKHGLMKVADENGEEHLIKTFKEAYEYCPDFRYYMDKYPSVKKHCEKIEGTFANFGAHASGIVVSDVPIDEIAPLRLARKGILATQYPMEDLETLGLIKFDILAISTLSVIRRTVQRIKEEYDIDIDLKNLPLDDEPTLDLYRKGSLGGVFQCERYGMQQTMRDISVDRFEDIVAGLALYRPGPMDSISKYCAIKKGEQEPDYFHPTIEPYVKPYLEGTYSVLCYQEQVMQICNALAGFSISDGYVVIKAIGKKKIYLMDKFKKQFVNGCIEKKVPADVADQYWEKFIKPFSSYGFNLCLDGSMCVRDKKDNKIYEIKNLEEEYRSGKKKNILLDSYVGGKIIEDELVDVFETGEKDVYEIKLDNGIVLKCTLDHKFMCEDGKEHLVSEIIKRDLNILYF